MRLVLVLCSVAALALAAPAFAKEPALTAPRTTAVGADVRLKLQDFPRNAAVEIWLIPTIHRGGNCCGVKAKLRNGRRTNAAGTALVIFRWPEFYERCGAATGCAKVRWLENQRVDILALVRNVRRTKIIRLTG